MNTHTDQGQDSAQVDVERLRLLYVSALPGGLASICFGLLAAAHYWTFGSHGLILAWLAFTTILEVARFFSLRVFAPSTTATQIPKNWALISGVLTTIAGISWGLGGLLFFNLTDGLQSYVIIVLIGAVNASVFPVLAGFPRLLIGFLAPSLSVVMFLLLTRGQGLDYVLATIFFVTALAMTGISGRLQAAIRQYLRLSYENAELLRSMGESKRHAEKLNTDLSEEINQRREIEQQLNDARLQAEAASMAKGEFLATMSHEIRTPLNGILPILDILRETDLSADQKDYLNTAFSSSKHLLSIIDDILDYSKIEAGKLELETVGINLRKLIDSVVRLMAKNAEVKNIELKDKIDANVRLALRGDPVRLRQVLTNLVSNAIKFTRKGQVLITISQRGSTQTHHEILFAVRDTGIGMSASQSKKLFQPFAQADASTTRLHGGTGLGLVICKRLVDLMGGQIGVKSELGKGSIFWFSVPLLKAVGDMSARTELTGVRALVVSKNDELKRRLKVFLDGWGMPNEFAQDGKKAQAEIRAANSRGASWRYELLLIDGRDVSVGASQLTAAINANPTLKEQLSMIVIDDSEGDGEGGIPKVPANIAQGDLHRIVSKAMGVRPPGELREQEAPKSLVEQAASMGAEKAAKRSAVKPGKAEGYALLVEDNPVNLHVARKLVKLVGLDLDEAHNGQEAVEKLEKFDYDLILMDCQMPIMDGYTATRTIRNKEAKSGGKRIPIIAMTANAMVGDKEKCLDAGMDDYMSKPLNRHVLEETIKKWLDAQGGAAPAKRKPAPSKPSVPASLPQVPDGEGVVDDTILKDLVDIMGDEFLELLEVYLEDSPRAVASLEEAAANNDLRALVAPAHSLKSTSANLGATRLSELAKALEHGARTGHLTGSMADMVAHLKAEHLAASRKLRAYLKG